MSRFRPTFKQRQKIGKEHSDTHTIRDPTRPNRNYTMRRPKDMPAMTDEEDKKILTSMAVRRNRIERKNVPVTLPTIKALIED